MFEIIYSMLISLDLRSKTYYQQVCTYLDFPFFEDGLRAHVVELHQIEIHQIDVAAVGRIGGDLKILQRKYTFCVSIPHRKNLL